MTPHPERAMASTETATGARFFTALDHPPGCCIEVCPEKGSRFIDEHGVREVWGPAWTLKALLRDVADGKRREVLEDDVPPRPLAARDAAKLAAFDGLLAAVVDLEWAGRQWCGAGAAMHRQHIDGTWDAACPVCHGIKPGCSNGWIESAFGHRDGCKLSAAITAAESAKGGA
jgi:hypothetical protein